MAASSTTKKVTLKSSDGETFEIDEAVALHSQTIKPMLEDVSDDSPIPLPNVTGKILAKVIEYSKKLVETSSVTTTTTTSTSTDDNHINDQLKDFNKEFMAVDQDTLFDLILAANYLENKSLLHLGCRTVADMMIGKKPEEIRNTFHIVNDYTPEEEEEVRKENAWAFE